MRLRKDNMLVFSTEEGRFSGPSVVPWTPPGAAEPVALIFPDTAGLAARFNAVADLWGNKAAVAFVGTVYAPHLVWLTCTDCGTETPFDKEEWEEDGYAHCLVCFTGQKNKKQRRHLRLV